jgi:hypothetical protein
MAKFKNLDQVKKEFLVRSNGGERLTRHQTRFSDIDAYAPVVERLLDTDYNKVSGFSFSELMEAISLVAENYSSADYVNAVRRDSKATKLDESFAKEVSGEDNFWACNEALNTATTAQAPYPVPSIALTTYQYEKAVLPYLCHQFDLKGNRGLVYYQKINAENAKGNVKAGDLLGSPKEMGVQPAAFVGTKNVDKYEVAELVVSQTTYDGITLPGAPIQAGSLMINIDGVAGYFKDFAQEGAPEEVALYSVGGNIGTAVVNLKTGALTIELKEPPTSVTGKAIYATYCRDIETIEGGKANMARAQVSLESKQLEAEDFSVFTETSIYQEALSKAIFGLDWNSQVDEALAALYNKEVANKIVAEIEQAIPTESIFTKSLATATGGNNELFNVQFMAVVMGKLGQLITTASGIGNNKLAALVVNIEVLPILRALPKFTAANADFEEVMGGMYLAGLYDGMPVIVGFPVYDAAGNVIALGSGEVIGIYKSKNKDFLTPYCWGTFILPIIRDIFDQDNLAVNRKQLIASAAGAVVAERLAAKLTITDIDTVIGG